MKPLRMYIDSSVFVVTSMWSSRNIQADDALHMVHTTRVRADVIVSWDFRHLVNFVQRRSFNGIKLGHRDGMTGALTADIENVSRRVVDMTLKNLEEKAKFQTLE